MWSKTLQKQTREHFQKFPTACVKHCDKPSDDRYGFCIKTEEGFQVMNKKDSAIEDFESIDDLIQSGWAID